MTQNDLHLPSEIFSSARKKAFAATEPLTPDAFRGPHFDPKQVRAGARCAGCQWTAALRLANETRFGAGRWRHWL